VDKRKRKKRKFGVYLLDIWLNFTSLIFTANDVWLKKIADFDLSFR